MIRSVQPTKKTSTFCNKQHGQMNIIYSKNMGKNARRRFFNKAGIMLIALICVAGLYATAQFKADGEKGAMPKADSGTNWFKNAKFGLFIHWGLYAKLAGNWQNKRYYGSGEWIMHQAKNTGG